MSEFINEFFSEFTRTLMLFAHKENNKGLDTRIVCRSSTISILSSDLKNEGKKYPFQY